MRGQSARTHAANGSANHCVRACVRACVRTWNVEGTTPPLGQQQQTETSDARTGLPKTLARRGLPTAPPPNDDDEGDAAALLPVPPPPGLGDSGFFLNSPRNFATFWSALLVPRKRGDLNAALVVGVPGDDDGGVRPLPPALLLLLLLLLPSLSSSTAAHVGRCCEEGEGGTAAAAAAAAAPSARAGGIGGPFLASLLPRPASIAPASLRVGGVGGALELLAEVATPSPPAAAAAAGGEACDPLAWGDLDFVGCGEAGAEDTGVEVLRR